jgi:hypothetical protein
VVAGSGPYPQQPQHPPAQYPPPGGHPPGPGTAISTGPPSKPPTKWKPWHRWTLGVIGGLFLFLCGVAIFAPDPDTSKPSTTDRQQAAAIGASATGPAQAQPAATATTKAVPRPSTTSKKPTVKPVYYADCDAASAKTDVPIAKGDPGYRKALDLDRDGLACEIYDDDPLVQQDEPDIDSDSEGGTDPRYSTCAKANDAGYGPYVRGKDLEYAWYRDRDSDGVVCES